MRQRRMPDRVDSRRELEGAAGKGEKGGLGRQRGKFDAVFACGLIWPAGWLLLMAAATGVSGSPSGRCPSCTEHRDGQAGSLRADVHGGFIPDVRCISVMIFRSRSRAFVSQTSHEDGGWLEWGRGGGGLKYMRTNRCFLKLTGRFTGC